MLFMALRSELNCNRIKVVTFIVVWSNTWTSIQKICTPLTFVILFNFTWIEKLKIKLLCWINYIYRCAPIYIPSKTVEFLVSILEYIKLPSPNLPLLSGQFSEAHEERQLPRAVEATLFSHGEKSCHPASLQFEVKDLPFQLAQLFFP